MSVEAAPTVPSRRAPRWMVALLIASLALNLLVVGAVTGSFWAFRHGGFWAGGGFAGSLLGYVSTLPAERRREIWRQAGDERRALRAYRQAVREARNEAIRALGTEPFDRERFRAALRRVHEAETTARAGAEPLFTAIPTLMTPTERQGFLRWRDHTRMRRGPPEGRDGDSDDEPRPPQQPAAPPR